MLLTPGQMLSYRSALLDRGRAGTRQLVPGPGSTPLHGARALAVQSGSTYGYGWWSRDFAGRQGCLAWGYGGQYVIVFRQ